MSRSSHDIIGSENLAGHRHYVQNLGKSVGRGEEIAAKDLD